MTDEFRTEHDSMGEVRVPRDALWRAQTQRAVENFPISGTRLERTECWTRAQWADQGVDVDHDWPKEGVRTIG